MKFAVAVSWIWKVLQGLLKKFTGGGGRSVSQTGTGHIAVQADNGSHVHLHVGPTAGPPQPERPVLTGVEVRLLRTAKAHQGLLPLMKESMSGRRAYVGPFGNEALECDRELEHLVEMGLLRHEPSDSRTIKFHLTSRGWEQLDTLGD